MNLVKFLNKYVIMGADIRCPDSYPRKSFLWIFQSPWGIFQQKYIDSESVLNYLYVSNVTETSKEVLAGSKMMLTF